MKKGMSSLNPYAASYIPLSKREAKDENKISETTTPPEGHSRTGQNYLHADTSVNSDIHDIEGLLFGEEVTKYQQNPSEQTEKHFMDEDSEMDLAYLAIKFPNISEQSLADLYSFNGGDLEASIDMLNQLEVPVDPVDVSEHLPDNLDIGDTSECKVSAEGSSMKLKSIFSGEASGSSSGPLGSSS